MRFRLDAAPGEVRQKREALLGALVRAVAADDPELADRLYKAQEPPAVQPEHLALQQMQLRLRDGYEAEMRRAVARIGAVLSRAQSEARKADAP